MFNRSLTLAIAAVGLMTLSGCYMYLDDDADGGGYTYCDDTGCWLCDDYGCYPADGDGGWGSCSSNYDCAPGCFCTASGACEEAGFCDDDSDCGAGMVCDDRASCVPDGTDGACTADGDCPWGSFCDAGSGQCVGSWTCTADEDCGPGMECDDRGTCVPSPCTNDDQCLEGCFCNESTGQCEETGVCDTDEDCEDGFECDDDRRTCVPCGAEGCVEPAPGECYAELVCDETAPACPAGSIPGIVDGCFSGFCIPEALCPDEPPFTCDAVETEAECVTAPTCRPVYVGVDCTDPMGNSCMAGATNCTCEDFRYGFCEDKP